MSIIREAAASARSQKVPTVVTILIVAAMCFSVLITAGRVAGSESAVLSSIDKIGSRVVVIRLQDDAGVGPAVVARIRLLSSVSWVGAFGPSVDAVNTAIPGAQPISVRDLWTDEPAAIGVQPDRYDGLWLSKESAQIGGFLAPVGSVTGTDGVQSTLIGELPSSSFINPLEPLALRLQRPNSDGAVSVLVIVVHSPESLSSVVSALPPLIGARDPNKIEVSTDGNLAHLQVLISNQLSFANQGLTIVILLISGLLVAGVMTALGVLRRRDFGRRRALGATRSFVLLLVLGQTMLCAIVGALVGAAAGLCGIALQALPLPTWQFALSVMLLSIGVSILAAITPAAIAANRDPIRELRTP